jgi:hypothetical protein
MNEVCKNVGTIQKLGKFVNAALELKQTLN